MKIWLSSTVRPSLGRAAMIAGPPVVKAKTRSPASGEPASVFSPSRSVKRQATPAARSRSKSKAQFFTSTQRPAPFSGQAISKGASLRGSPKVVIASEKRAITWRTFLIVPWGAKDSTRAASCAWHNPAVARSKRVRQRDEKRCMQVASLIAEQIKLRKHMNLVKNGFAQRRKARKEIQII